MTDEYSKQLYSGKLCRNRVSGCNCLYREWRWTELEKAKDPY